MEPEQDLPENITTLGEFTLHRTRSYEQRARAECAHKRLDLDDAGDIVTCEDCGKQVSAFWALCSLAAEINRTLRDARRVREQAAWERSHTVRLRAAKAVEQTWRRHMVPCCPFCNQGLRPDDVMRMEAIHPDLAMQRREALTMKGQKTL